MISYATLEDVENALPDEDYSSDDLSLMILHASRLVDDACKWGIYEVDDEDYPLDIKILEAFNRAVITQIRFWVTNGISPVRGSGSVAAAANLKYPIPNADISYGSINIASPKINVADKDNYVKELENSFYFLIPGAWYLLPSELTSVNIFMRGW